MLRFVQQVWLAIADLVRSRAVLHAEVIRLRHENAVLRRRAAPRRVPLGNGDRLFLVCLYRLWPQLAKLSRLVSPATLIRWHRGGFRAYWRWKSRAKPGRPKIDRALIALIKRLARENPVWGAPRVHGELLKLGFGIAQSTVSMYMPSRKGGTSPQNWRTFLRNHAREIAAIDMCVVPAIDFRLLYVLIVVRHGTREVISTAVTRHPSATWLANQITEAFPWNEAPRFLIRDNDGAYGEIFRRRLRAMGIRDRPIAPHSPWQNGYAERLIGSVRRECLDHVIPLSESHLHNVLREYVDYTTTTTCEPIFRSPRTRPAGDVSRPAARS